MNILLFIGYFLLLAYTIGSIFNYLGLPRIIGYISTGIILSPDLHPKISQSFLTDIEPLLEMCLAFICFEVGNSLKFGNIFKRGKTIFLITMAASILPFILIIISYLAFICLFPQFCTLENQAAVVALAILLGALASPTDPSVTLAVTHQYKAHGIVTRTILGVAAIDDAIGIILFSIGTSVAELLMGSNPGLTSISTDIFIKLFGSIALGVILAMTMNLLTNKFNLETASHWIILILSFILLGFGIAKSLKMDELLVCMSMGGTVANRNPKHKYIFRMLERYTEELVFLLFFVLSGMHLNIFTIHKAGVLITVYIVFRGLGKYLGAYLGALSTRSKKIRRYTGGGLIPQGGIVIGLTLMISKNPLFSEISNTLVTVVMGATVIHELIGPIITKHSLEKSGEIK